MLRVLCQYIVLINTQLLHNFEHFLKNVFIYLGNKADCGPERQVKKEEGERLAREYNVTFMETSAKTGVNVELAFLAIAR